MVEVALLVVVVVVVAMIVAMGRARVWRET
jgi:hypothetical protein